MCINPLAPVSKGSLGKHLQSINKKDADKDFKYLANLSGKFRTNINGLVQRMPPL